MTGRPLIAPPVAPTRQVPVAPPALPPVLQMASPVDRWHYWRLFCAFGGLGAGTGYGAAQAWAAGADPGLVGFAALLLAGIALSGLGWTHRDYSAALHAERTARVAQAGTLTAGLAEWQASLETERAMLAAWSAHEHGPRRPAPAEAGPTINRAEQQAQQRAALVADIARVVVAELAPLLQPAPPPAEPERARVTPAEQVTAHLDPARDLLAAAYYDGPAWVFMRAAWQGDDITHEALAKGTAPFMTSGQWKDLARLFGDAGILHKAGQTAPWQFNPRYKVATEAACHNAVLDQLLAAGVMPQTIRDAGKVKQRAQP